MREEAPPTPKSKREYERKRTPIEEKESLRWVDSYRQAHQESLELTDTQLVCVADSEADIYELLEEAQAEPQGADSIIRAGQDRALIPCAIVADTIQNVIRVSLPPVRIPARGRLRARAGIPRLGRQLSIIDRILRR